MKNFKWGTESFNDSPIYVVLFVSRNKDNRNIKGFVERRKSFLIHMNDGSYEKTYNDFRNFIDAGVEGEMSRMYISVNERDGEKIYKNLLHFLIDTPNFNLCSINSKLAGIAAQKECAKTKKWMFDFDSNNANLLGKFLTDIANAVHLSGQTDVFIEPVLPTPHGYAVVVSKGFDTRELMDKWKDIVTLKRDDLVCIRWGEKG